MLLSSSVLVAALLASPVPDAGDQAMQPMAKEYKGVEVTLVSLKRVPEQVKGTVVTRPTEPGFELAVVGLTVAPMPNSRADRITLEPAQIELVDAAGTGYKPEVGLSVPLGSPEKKFPSDVVIGVPKNAKLEKLVIGTAVYTLK